MRNSTRKVLCKIFPAVFLAAFALPSIVEQSSAADLEEVIVTAQRREQSVNDVPITISAFSGEKLKDLGVIDTRDLGKIVPGFKYSATGLNKPVFTLRGVGYNDFSQTASGTVGVYLGEFNLPYPVMAKGPTLDIQRIEVLKGPQGTLYGRNTTAGVVNFIPKRRTEDFQAGITVTYGRFETYDMEAYVSGHVLESLGMRLAARKIKSSEAWQYSLTRPNDELGIQDKWSARFTTEWMPTDSLDMSLGIDHWEDHSDSQAAQPIAIEAVNPFVGNVALDPSVRNHPLVPYHTDNSRVADWPPKSKGYSWQFNDTFSMGRFRVNWDVWQDATLSYLFGVSEFKSDDTTLPISGLSSLNAEAITNVKTTAWTQELRFVGSWGDSFNYIFGGFFSSDDVYQFWTGLTDTISTLVPVNGQSTIASKVDSFVDQHSDTQAGFFDITWAFIPSMSFSTGVRATQEKRDFKGCTKDNESAEGVGLSNLINVVSLARGGTGGAERGGCITMDHDTGNPGIVSKELNENNVSGRLVLDWTPVDGLLFYVSRSRGFKSGSFPIGQATDSEQYRPAIQEQLDSWEVGGKLSLFEQSLQLNFAAFDYDYKNKQLLSYTLDPYFGALQQLDNAPKSTVQGGEIDIRARPLESLEMFLAASYVDTEIKKFVGTNQSGETEDFSGEKFNNAPAFMGSAGFNYVWDVPWFDAFNLSLGADYSYTGKTSSALDNDSRYRIFAYDNVNCRIGLVSTDNSWKVTAWGRNITDEYQPISVGATASDVIQRYVQMPRTYGLTVQYDYGPR